MTGTTWTLSGFGDEIDPDPAIQLSVLRALGTRHIEVRSAWGTNIVELSGDQLDRFAALLRDRDMAVSAVASPVGKVDVFDEPAPELARLAKAIAAAHPLGPRDLRVVSVYRPPGGTGEKTRHPALAPVRAMA